MKAKGRVLLASKDEKTRASMVRILNNNSYVTQVVDSCIEVLDHLLQQDYDVIIVDSNLREMSGLDVIDFIKRFHQRRETVVLITDDASPETAVRIAEIGPYYTLDKPLDRECTRQLVKSFEERLNRVQPTKFEHSK